MVWAAAPADTKAVAKGAAMKAVKRSNDPTRVVIVFLSGIKRLS